MSQQPWRLTASQRDVAAEARRVLSDLDSTGLADMTGLYYANSSENLSVVLRDLLDALDAAGADDPNLATSHAATPVAQLARLNATLERSGALRVQRIQFLGDGARFRGLNEMLSNLDELRSAFAADSALQKVTFLIDRCIADFETAIETALLDTSLSRWRRCAM